MPTVSYIFICACGCGQVSEPLGKEYIKLSSKQKWVARGDETGKKIIKEFKGGFVIEEADF